MPPKKNPKYPCGTCNKSATTNALLCNFCNMWHHATLECIPWHTKETIDALMEICKTQTCWSCQKCTGIMKKLNGRIAKLEQDVENVKEDITTLQTKQGSMDDEVTDLKNKFSELRDDVTGKSTNDQSEVLLEMKDREERKCNVIINGMKESAATEKEQVYAEENQLLNNLFNDMQMDAGSTSEKIKFKTRLGPKQPGKSRPFLVKFRDHGTRDSVLRKASKLPVGGARIKPDLTKKQREEDEKFKRKLDEDNEAEPTDESGDFRWKVAGPPGNLRKVKFHNIQQWEEERQRRQMVREAAE
jgi:hypothetical protein